MAMHWPWRGTGDGGTGPSAERCWGAIIGLDRSWEAARQSGYTMHLQLSPLGDTNRRHWRRQTQQWCREGDGGGGGSQPPGHLRLIYRNSVSRFQQNNRCSRVQIHVQIILMVSRGLFNWQGMQMADWDHYYLHDVTRASLNSGQGHQSERSTGAAGVERDFFTRINCVASKLIR